MSTEPWSAYCLDCADLVDEALALDTVSFPSPRSTRSSPPRAWVPRFPANLDHLQGGTVCEWSNGVPVNDQYGSDPAYVGVVVSVTAEAGHPDGRPKATQYGMPSNDFGALPISA